MEAINIHDVVTIFGISLGLLFIASRIKLPSIVAYILSGVIVGPFGLQLVQKEHVQELASLGIILLLFMIGVEFSIKRLLSMKKLFLIGGAFQMFFTGLYGFGAAMLFDRPMGESIFVGILIALSSSAIVLKCLEQRKESNTSYGNYILAVTIFQDVVTIPMLLAVPYLAGVPLESGETSFLEPILKGGAILVFIYFSATFLVPRLMWYIVKTKSREIFLLTIFFICFFVIWFTGEMGLPASLGAFLAGLTVSESEYRHQAISDVIPFQDILTCFFFASLGMLLDLHFVINQPFLILMLATSIIFVKCGVVTIGAILLKYPIRSALLSGIYLAQVGEFAFVLAKSGRDAGIGTDYLFQLFLAVSLLTIGVAPFLIGYSSKILHRVQKWNLPDRIRYGAKLIEKESREPLVNHVAILGFGVTGKNIAKSSMSAHIPYMAIDFNGVLVKDSEKDFSVVFGDATHEFALRRLKIENANIVAIVLNDMASAYQAISVVKGINPNAYVIVRAKTLNDLDVLKKAGADEVIADELEISIEIFTRVLKKYLIPKDEIQKLVSNTRSRTYQQARSHSFPEELSMSDMQLHNKSLKVETIRVHADSSLVGKTLGTSNLRKDFGATVLMIKRDIEAVTDLNADTIIIEQDLLVLFGEEDKLEKIKGICHETTHS